jgi:hypothetical protein
MPFTYPMRARLSTIAILEACWTPLLFCQPSFLALLLASRTAPDSSESDGCFRDTLLLSRFCSTRRRRLVENRGAFCPDCRATPLMAGQRHDRMAGLGDRRLGVARP